MDFREAKLMIAVAEYGNITKAAESLYMSQPALSHYVNKVEEKLGVRLFDRSTNPLTLTYAGEQYMTTVREMMRMNDQLTKQFRDISQNMTGRIHLGIPRERGAYMLPELLVKFKEAYPGIEVQVLTDSIDELLNVLRKGRVDMVIAPVCGTEYRKEFRVEELFREELLLVGNREKLTPEYFVPGHPDVIDLEAVSKLPFYLLYKSHAGRQIVDRIMKERGLKPKIAMESASNITCCRLAAAGLGVTIVSEVTCALLMPSEQEIRCHLDVEPVTWAVAAISRPDAYLGKVEQDLIGMVRSMQKFA